MLQEAATSTQEGSTDSSSSDKIMIALHKEAESTEIVITDELEPIEGPTATHVTNE